MGTTRARGAVAISAAILMISLAFHPAGAIQGTAPQVATPARQLQVLSDIPESQLFLVMNAVATSLGVGCDYCHVRDAPSAQTVVGGWHFEKNDKPTKAKGLEMMRMVRELNKTQFAGKPVVTCYTCHRGSTRVLGAPPLPPNERPDPNASPVPLPSAQTVLQKYIAAVGGADAATRHTTTVMQGRDDRSESRHGDLTISIKGADRFRVDLRWPNQPAIAQALNGSAAWISSGTAAPQTLAAPDVARLQRIAVRYRPLKVPERAEAMRVERIESVSGRDAFVVLASVDANSSRRYYFDVATGLLVRELITTTTPFVPIQEQVEYGDYRPVDGVVLPFIIRSSNEAPYDTSTKTFTSIRHNFPLEDGLFVIPGRIY